MSNTEKNWKECLTEDEYKILREKGTEPRFSGDHVDRKSDGIYVCSGCKSELFHSDDKFDSGTGWPSFSDLIDEDNINLETDMRHGMKRTEVLCSDCGGHLGHVFDDGPKPTGKRYCINSVALDFESKQDSVQN